MKIMTSYFYQIRFMKQNYIPLSTAIWDPKWFHQNKGQDFQFKDKNGVWNGLRAEIFMPGKECGSARFANVKQVCKILEDKDETWAKARAEWGTDEDYKELNANMDMMKNGFIDKGIPVIVGEYGCPTKGKEPDSVRLFLSSVCRSAYERGLCPILWSTPDSTTDDGTVIKGHYNRKTCKMEDQELKKLFNEITGFKLKNF